MMAFEIQIDDAPPVTTGAEDWQVLTLALTAARGQPHLADKDDRGDLHVHAGGLAGGTTAEDGEHLRWTLPPVAVGSRVCVRVLDTARPDPPAERGRPDQDEDSRISEVFRARRYKDYLKLKAEFEPDAG